MGFFSQQRHLVASFAYVVLPDDPRDPRIGAYGTLHVDVVALFDERGLQFAAQFQAHHWNICQRERERENSHRISTELDKTKERERERERERESLHWTLSFQVSSRTEVTSCRFSARHVRYWPPSSADTSSDSVLAVTLPSNET